jgi:branched-chain amino acid transport system permease protein
VWGLIIALIALGLSIIFGLLDIINVAHGDFFMLGTVFAWLIATATGNYWVAFLVVPLIGLLLGALTERCVLRPIEDSARLSSPHSDFAILQEGVRATFGATPKRLLDPIGITFPIFNLQYEVYRLFAAVIAIVAIGGFFIFLHHTKFGTWMRAVRQDKDMAIAMGVPANRVFAVTFALGTSLAMFGGVVAAPITSVNSVGAGPVLYSRNWRLGTTVRRRPRCCCR